MSLIGLIVIFIALGVGIAGEATTLIAQTSLFITFGGAIGLLLFSGTNISAMFKGAFAKNATADELRAGARGFDREGRRSPSNRRVRQSSHLRIQRRTSVGRRPFSNPNRG